MPNLPAHMDLAYQAARQLGDAPLAAHMGHYLLGSTTPDIRAMTKGTREQYHFTALSFDNAGAGAKGLFAAHPDLSGNGTDAPTRAFVAGYITHLALDETWITQMFRPLFGNAEVFEDEVRGKVADRVFQLELDRLAQPAMKATLPLIAAATDQPEVEFIASEDLDAWRNWVVELVGRGFTWDRLRFMARRVAGGEEGHPAHGMADQFLRDMPESLNDLYGYVSTEELAGFREKSVQVLVGALRDYLS